MNNPTRKRFAERTVRAALFMQAELARFNRFLPGGVPPLVAGIGVHAGPLITGIVGSPQKRSFTVLGDTVNTASRVEGMSKLLNAPILVTSEVEGGLRNDLRRSLLPLGRFRPRGRQGVVSVAAACADAVDATRTQAQEALQALHAGDFPRAADLLSSLARARTGQPGDRAYALQARVADSYVHAPPPPDWQGAVALTEK